MHAFKLGIMDYWYMLYGRIDEKDFHLHNLTKFRNWYEHLLKFLLCVKHKCIRSSLPVNWGRLGFYPKGIFKSVKKKNVSDCGVDHKG